MYRRKIKHLGLVIRFLFRTVLKRVAAFTCLILFGALFLSYLPANTQTLQGQVITTEKSAPIKNIELFLYDFHPYFHPGVDTPLQQTNVDSEGEFTLHISGNNKYLLLAKKDHQVYFQKIISGDMSRIEVLLEDAPDLSGTIYDGDGNAIRNALIGPLVLSEEKDGMPYYTWTDEEGRFRFFDLPAIHYQITAFISGFTPHIQEGVLPDREIEVILRKGGLDINGKVVGSRNLLPLENIPVVLKGVDFYSVLSTDSKGLFVFDSLPPDQYSIFCIEQGVPWSEKKSVELQDQDIINLVLEYDQGVHLGGELKDITTGEPLSRFSFFVHSASGEREFINTDAHGTFMIPHLVFNEPLTFEVEDSRYRFVTKENEEEEYKNQISFPEISSREDEYDIEVFVLKSGIIQGEIRAEENVLRDYSWYVRCITDGHDSLTDFDTINEDGSFTVHVFQPGKQYLFAYTAEGRYATSITTTHWQTGESAAEIRYLDVKPTGRIFIQTEDGFDYLAEPFNIRAISPEYGNLLVGRYSYSPHEEKLLHDLPMENIELRYISQDGLFRGQQTVNLPVENDKVIQLDFKEIHTVSGYVKNVHDEPLQDVLIHVQYQEDIMEQYPYEFSTASDGSFTIKPYIAEEMKYISFSHADEGEYIIDDPVKVTDDMEIVLTPHQVYKATLFESRNRLFSGEIVVYYRHEEDEEYTRKEVEVSEGELQIRGLQEGTNHFILEEPHMNLSYQGKWNITESTARLPDILLVAARDFWGYVVDNSRRPIAEAEVMLSTPLYTYEDITNKSGFFSFEKLPGTVFDIKVSYSGYSTFEDTLDLSTLSLPYYIHLTRAFRKIFGQITIPDNMRYGLEIIFTDPEDVNETYRAEIYNDEYEIDEIALEEGILKVKSEGRRLISENMQFNEEDTIEYNINLEHFITVSGELQVDPVFTAYPLLFQNKETGEEYRAHIDYGDYSYVVEVPAGEYDILLGPMYLDIEVSLQNSVDSCDLGFDFEF